MRVHPSSTPELLAKEIRSAIAAGEFVSGKPLPQEALAARYGVSRSPLREALRLLEAHGVIEYRSNRGAFVATFNEDELGQLIEIRRILEQALIAHAIPNIGAPLVEQARMRLRQMKESTDHREWLSLHFAFHLELYDAAKRPKMHDLVARHVLPVSHLADSKERVAELRRVLHVADRRIVDACVAKDVSAAVSALDAHYEPMVGLLCHPLGTAD